MLADMSNRDFNDTTTAHVIFDDPVAYLAEHGIEAELVAETSLPAAA